MYGQSPRPKRSNTALLMGIAIGIAIAVVAGAVVAFFISTRHQRSAPETQQIQPAQSSLPQQAPATASTPAGVPSSTTGSTPTIDAVSLAMAVKKQQSHKSEVPIADVRCDGELPETIGSSQRCTLTRTDGLIIGLTVSVISMTPMPKLNVQVDQTPIGTTTAVPATP